MKKTAKIVKKTTKKTNNKQLFFLTGFAAILLLVSGFFFFSSDKKVDASARAVGLIYCVHPCITNSTHPSTDPASCQYKSNPIHCTPRGGYIGTYDGCSGTGLACVFNYTPRPTPTPVRRPTPTPKPLWCNPRFHICFF